jgi:hypothetical protein
MTGPGDHPPSEDEDYIGKVMLPLALGLGVAMFWAKQDGALAGVAAQYRPGKAEAIDPDWRTRVHEAIRAQASAREIARTMGLEAVVA